MKTLRYQVFLFGDCNNKCGFCFQDKMELNSRHNVVKICETVYKLQDCLNSIENPEQYDIILVTIFGGELFCWQEPVLYYLYEQIVDRLTLPNITLRVVTNLLYNNTKKLEDFIYYVRCKKVKLDLATSFDFESRFHTGDRLELFFDNYKKIIKIYPELSCVCTITKELCRKFKSLYYTHGEDGYNKYWNVFRYIYKSNPDGFEWLMYLKNANKEHNEKNLPTDKDLYHFYVALRKYYPELYKKWFIEFPEKTSWPCYENDVHRIIVNGQDHDERKFLLDKTNKSTPFYRSCHFKPTYCYTCEWYLKCQKLCYCNFEFTSPTKEYCYLKRLFLLDKFNPLNLLQM